MTADDVISGKADRVRDRAYPPENASTYQGVFSSAINILLMSTTIEFCHDYGQFPATSIIGDPVQGDRILGHGLRLSVPQPKVTQRGH